MGAGRGSPKRPSFALSKALLGPFRRFRCYGEGLKILWRVAKSAWAPPFRSTGMSRFPCKCQQTMVSRESGGTDFAHPKERPSQLLGFRLSPCNTIPKGDAEPQQKDTHSFQVHGGRLSFFETSGCLNMKHHRSTCLLQLGQGKGSRSVAPSTISPATVVDSS